MNHGGMGNDTKSCPMKMIFHARSCERILWQDWLAYTMVEFVFSAIAIFAMAFFYEFIKFVREYLQQKAAKQEAERVAIEMRSKKGSACGAAAGSNTCSNALMPELRQRTYKEQIFEKNHIIQSLLNIIQIVLSYLLMLVFMLCNYWLCLATILGLGLGYFFFGWIKKSSYEGGDCCD